MRNTIIGTAFMNALLSALYITAVGSFLFYIPKFFGQGGSDTVLVPVFMLSLFVFSAALMGVLIFGRPIMWYLDNKKREALSLISYTLGIFFLLMLAFFLTLYRMLR